jgi:hypothetical protein
MPSPPRCVLPPCVQMLMRAAPLCAAPLCAAPLCADVDDGLRWWELHQLTTLNDL